MKILKNKEMRNSYKYKRQNFWLKVVVGVQMIIIIILLLLLNQCRSYNKELPVRNDILISTNSIYHLMIVELKKENDALKNRLSDTEKQLGENNNRISKLENRLIHATQQVNSLKKENSELKLKIRELSKQINSRDSINVDSNDSLNSQKINPCDSILNTNSFYNFSVIAEKNVFNKKNVLVDKEIVGVCNNTVIHNEGFGFKPSPIYYNYSYLDENGFASELNFIGFVSEDELILQATDNFGKILFYKTEKVSLGAGGLPINDKGEPIIGNLSYNIKEKIFKEDVYRRGGREIIFGVVLLPSGVVSFIHFKNHPEATFNIFKGGDIVSSNKVYNDFGKGISIVGGLTGAYLLGKGIGDRYFFCYNIQNNQFVFKYKF